MLHFVEELLNRWLFRSFSCIHINELVFRHIIEKLDGPNSYDKGWCGPVGKLLSKVETNFMLIPLLEPLIQIAEDVVKGISKLALN